MKKKQPLSLVPADAAAAKPKPKRKAKPKAKLGRPSSYDPKVGTAICEAMANGKSLTAICKPAGMPDRNTVYRWMENDAAFAAECARARELQADFMDEQIAKVIASCARGARGLSPDRARVVLSGLQWRAAKLAPKVYGDKLDVTGAGGTTIVNVMRFTSAPLPGAADPPALEHAPDDHDSQ